MRLPSAAFARDGHRTKLANGSLTYPAEFHAGVAIGEPFSVEPLCSNIQNLGADHVMNWGTDAGDGSSITVCDACEPRFVPTLWGRDFDDDNLKKLPSDEAPWAILLENEPNWWGFADLNAEHGQGSNMTAGDAAARWKDHKQLVDSKWGKPLTKWISPSPVSDLYKNCGPGEMVGCKWQSQFDWLDQYFAGCGGCLDNMWALQAHEYSCKMDQTKKRITDLASRYGKPVFVGELGCNGPSADEQAKYLSDFVTWAYNESSVVGYVWTGVNNVGAKNSQLVSNGQLTAVGTAYKEAQQSAPSSDG